jgi:predicted dehydrogenase
VSEDLAEGRVAVERREFIGTAAVVTAASARNVLGANERVNVALVGCGTRGLAVARPMRGLPNVAFVAACDVYETNAGRAKRLLGDGCQTCGDFRKVLDRKDVDAVVVATPDHWHAIPAVLACQAGKDVYVEKPLAHNIREGRAIVEATRKHKRVVQVGTQHRSAKHYREVARIVQGGELGKVRFVRVWNYTNAYPRGIGPADAKQPAGLDWDFYLGPAPAVPFSRGRFLNTFRWFWDYAGGFITDWGTHRFDSVHQVMGEDAPRTVTAVGGRFELKDGAETPDVLQATFEYPSFVLSYESNQLNAHGTGGRTPDKRYYRARGKDDRPHGEAFYGTNGTLVSDRVGYEVFPEPGRMKRSEAAGQDATEEHVKEFIDCVRSRKDPSAAVEIGHKAATVAHLGNIAYRTGRKLRWDAAKETILDDPKAAALLARAARKPWDLI